MKVYIGIDWSEKKHDAVFLNSAGAVIYRLTFPHTPEGYQQFEQVRKKFKLSPEQCLVGLETSHNILIDFLWDRNYQQVYVIPPNAVKSSQGRYRQSAARNDQSDARLIADMLRTDLPRWQVWRPGSSLVRQMKAKVSMINYLTRQIIGSSNRLRAVLLRYYPAALRVFSGLQAQITLKFIQTYPTPTAATELDYAKFEQFSRQNGYRQSKRLLACFDRLQQVEVVAAPIVVQAYQAEAQLLARLLLAEIQAKSQALRILHNLFQQHPDAHIFSSLPGAGQFLAPALLSKLGDDRSRFPAPANLQALAGTCPVTISSGKRKTVRFRRSCDTEFRTIVQQWAKASLRSSAWADLYYQRTRPHCKSQSHAYRRLGNRWLAIAWTLWQKSTPYDEAYHLQQHAIRAKPLAQ
jgi:transposase